MSETPPELEVLFIDMDAFFASVEQMDHPHLRGRPVGVTPTPGPSGCCIATSYEARRHNVKTGCRVGEARQRCPGITIVRSRPDRYIEVHHAVLAAIEKCVPVACVESVDECWALLMKNEQPRDRAETIALAIKEQIRQDVGPITCSIGIASNRLVAKVAGAMRKPDGLSVVERSSLPGALLGLELTDLPGIADNIARRLRAHRIVTMEDLYAQSPAQLRAAWGSVLGVYWWHWIRGERVEGPATRRRTVGHQHVLAPKFRSPEHARGVAVRLLSKAAQRMRSLGYAATRLSMHIRYTDRSGWADWSPVDETDDTIALTDELYTLWARAPRREVMRIGVTLEGLSPANRQLLLPFDAPGTAAGRGPDAGRGQLMRALDVVNRKHGHDAVYLGSMHAERKSAPRRIPFGQPPDLSLPDIEERETE
ncbi:MAG: DNA polymerase IV [Phycisphaerales bacterium]